MREADPASPPVPLMHVGYIKTGTTYLQHEVFSRPETGFALAGGVLNRALLVEHLVASDGYRFDPAETAHQFRAEAETVPTGCIPVWSDETLLGNPLQVRYHGPVVLNRLRRIGVPFKVLISIREQKSFSYSAYIEYLKRGAHSLLDFIGDGSEQTSFRPILNPEFLEYDVAVRAWQEVFGTENVLVLPYELLRAQPETFMDTLCRFAGVEGRLGLSGATVNKGMSAKAMVVNRAMNRFLLRSPRHQRASLSLRAGLRLIKVVDKVPSHALDRHIEGKWRAAIHERFDGAFTQSNRRLAHLTGLDLRALGYDA